MWRPQLGVLDYLPHNVEFKLHPMGKEAKEVLCEGLLRQTGTRDPLLQCFCLDICLLEQPNAKKL